MSGQATELTRPIRPRVVLKLFGRLCVVLGMLFAVPVVAAVLTGDFAFALWTGLTAAVLGGGGAALSRLSGPEELQTNEALLLAAGMFLLASLAMTGPLTREGLNWLDALFESVSGVTTTGLSTLASVEDRSAAFLFARAWMQWFGGLGIIAFSVALLIHPGAAARGFAALESDKDELAGSTRQHARRVLAVYCALTAAGMLILLVAGLSPFRAVVYTCAAVSTGGFAPDDASLAALPHWTMQAAVMLVSFLGAFPLSIWFLAYRRRGHEALRNAQVRGLLFATVFAVLLLAGSMRAAGAWTGLEILRHGALMGVSAQSTTGFSTLPVQQLSSASKLVLIVAMFVGGGMGSTAGGIKILRLLVLLRAVQLLLARSSVPPHAVMEFRLGGHHFDDAEIREVLLIPLLFLIAVALSWLPFLAYGYDPLDALFEVVSALGTVGLSSGVTAPGLPPLLKGVLCADMLLGRLEIVAWLTVFYHRTWFRKRKVA